MTFKFLTIQYEWKYIGWSQRTVHHTQWRKTQMTVDFSSDSYDQETMECSVQFSQSVMSASVTPWTAAHQASLSITSSWSLPKPMSIESVMPSNHLILCCPLLLLPSSFPSIRVFSSESALHIRWPKYCNFSFRITPSNEYSGLLSFRVGWWGLLAVQGTLKSGL